MPNLAATLKQEIRRLARREIRAEISSTRRAAVQHRREIAALKKLLRVQQRKIAALATKVPEISAVAAAGDAATEGARFSARSVRAQRKRLKLSAADFGKLIGVSGQTVYHWEQGQARPRKAQFAALITVRGLGRREALKRLE
jgi:DNA-binding transcriptional regulator YiaG